MRSDARPKAHLCGVSWRQPPAQQAEAGEGGRAADSAARSFQFGGTHILLLWAEGPRRGQEWGEGLSRGGRSRVHPQGRLWRGAAKGHLECALPALRDILRGWEGMSLTKRETDAKAKSR